jgi:hypothetical protein
MKSAGLLKENGCAIFRRVSVDFLACPPGDNYRSLPGKCFCRCAPVPTMKQPMFLSRRG